jgi:hypothetical protein
MNSCARQHFFVLDSALDGLYRIVTFPALKRPVTVVPDANVLIAMLSVLTSRLSPPGRSTT